MCLCRSNLSRALKILVLLVNKRKEDLPRIYPEPTEQRNRGAKSQLKKIVKKCNSFFASCIFYDILFGTMIMGVFAFYGLSPVKSLVFI